MRKKHCHACGHKHRCSKETTAGKWECPVRGCPCGHGTFAPIPKMVKP